MFFCSSKNEFSIRWRFFQSLEKCIECCLRKHVDLVYDIDFIFSDLRRYSNLIDEVANIIDRIIGSRIQLIDIKRV